MQVAFVDNQDVGETDAQAFQLYQQGPVNSLVTMENDGVNDINYRFQAFSVTYGTWSDLDDVGTPLNDTLAAGATLAVAVATASNQVRLLANASGGALLVFSSMQEVVRASGGQLPLINF